MIKLKKMMESCQENSPEYAALFAYYEKLAAVLTDKADLGVHINEKPTPFSPAMLGRME